jgi:hypothetical protein
MRDMREPLEREDSAIKRGFCTRDVSRLVEDGTVNGAGASLARAPYKSWPPRSGKRLTSPGAIEGKLDVLRVECTQVQGPLSF